MWSPVFPLMFSFIVHLRYRTSNIILKFLFAGHLRSSVNTTIQSDQLFQLHDLYITSESSSVLILLPLINKFSYNQMTEFWPKLSVPNYCFTVY